MSTELLETASVRLLVASAARDDGDGEGGAAHVHCGNCLAQGPVTDSIRSAVSAWNMRRGIVTALHL
jgi:hypothetical protein